MKGKEGLLDFSMDEDQQPADKNVYSSLKYQNNRGFDSKAMEKNMLRNEEEDDYHNAVVIPSVKKKTKVMLNKNVKGMKMKEEVRKEEVIKEEVMKEEGENINSTAHPGIHLLHQIECESSDQEQEEKQEVHPPKSKIIQKQQRSNQYNIHISTSARKNILDVDFDDNDDDDDSVSSDEKYKNQTSQQNNHRQLVKLLSLRPSERTPVSLKDIAISHDPIQNMRVYTQKPVELGKILNLQIVRNATGLASFWPEFKVYLSDNGAKMMVAKKMVGNYSSNFYITLESGVDNLKHQMFIAKLRANGSQNIYNIYTKGANPEKAVFNQPKRGIEATIVFKGQQKDKQPRQFEVFTLAKDVEYRDLNGVQEYQEVGLNELYKLEENKKKIFNFVNRKPIYSQGVGGYILNFGGRVQMASIKNFILEDTIAHREALMVGKTDNDIFRLDVSWPLKPYVGLAICLANIDSTYSGGV